MTAKVFLIVVLILSFLGAAAAVLSYQQGEDVDREVPANQPENPA